ncbi:alpha/beta hydrolase family protein [Actinocorallia sp. B10E7]|uniref:alpha/beta hydrolase n=1 Tax=Actinocorallia sp. B10E7 TaxID=3153558 RepID=UPI00325EB9B7
MKLREFGRLVTGAVAALGLGLSAAPAAAEPGPPAAGYTTADSGARITDERWVDERTVDITIDTPGVTGMDPQARILVPEGWSRDAARTWPVLYALSGGPDTYTIWTDKTDIEETSKDDDVIVVMPDSGKGGGFVDWYNGGRGGNPKWETFHTRELTQLVERNFRGGTDRAVMGLSSGGSGALMYATRNPGFYKYAASYSGLAHITKPGVPTIMLLSDMIDGSTENPDPYGKLGDPLWDRWNWLEHDPYVNAGDLRGTGVYLSSGTTGLVGELDLTPEEVFEQKDGDAVEVVKAYVAGSISEKLIGMTNEDLAARLKAMNIPATVHLYGDGLHSWPWWNREYKLAWPMIMKALGA